MASLVILNCKCVTMDANRPTCEAIAVSGDKILAIGTNEEISKLIRSSTKVIDANNVSVLPGFIDSHVHLTQTGLNKTVANLMDVKNHTEFFHVLHEHEKTLADNEWLRGFGYNENLFTEKQLPSIQELDSIFPDRPVFLTRTDSHSCFVNTTAFNLLNIPSETAGVELDANGHAIGILKGAANSKARKEILDSHIEAETRKKALIRACKDALAEGVTTIHALEGGEVFSDLDVETFLAIQDTLPVRTVLYHQTMDVKKVIQEGLSRIGGCILVDGSLGSRTAALFEPYCDNPTTGTCYYEQHVIDEFVLEAHKNGLQISMHTIGDRAIEMLLSAYEKALTAYPRKDHRHRFEHFSIPTYDQVSRAGKLGICVSTQPVFDYYGGSENGLHLRILGPERKKRTYMQRTLVEAGILLSGSSDSDVSPIAPMLGIYSAVSNSKPAERLTLFEAIKLFTINSAKLAFEEDIKGTVTAGKLADLVILDRDIFASFPADLLKVKIDKTILGGEVVYSL